jgi:phosphoribosyl 1,2-cyclic phosphodiesterase
MAIATDMGEYTDYTVEHLKDMDAILIESNHDVRMLQVGPYPYPLKQRILSDKGHLSNETAGRLLSDILCDRMQTIILGHLSKENNLPELAYETVRLEIETGDQDYHADDFEMIVAKRSEPTKIVEI